MEFIFETKNIVSFFKFERVYLDLVSGYLMIKTDDHSIYYCNTMERQNCLMVVVSVILGGYVVIFSSYVIIFGD